MLAVFVSCQAFGQTATFNATTFGSSEFENAENSWSNNTVTISAEWQPNTINVSYDLNGGTGSVSGAGTTCTYGESIELPEQPTRLGYTFGGWRVHGAGQKTCFNDIATEAIAGSQITYNGSNWNMFLTDNSGVVTGVFRCGNSRLESAGDALSIENYGYGNEYERLPSFSDDSRYCWCGVNQYVPVNGDECNATTYNTPVFGGDLETFQNCDANCAQICATLFGSDSDAADAMIEGAVNGYQTY